MYSTTNNKLNRKILINNRYYQLQKCCSNKISTCKYSLFTFLPRFLLEQFSQYSNMFFLVIALLQQIKDVSSTGRYTTLVPLSIILCVSAIKEIFENVKRKKMDTIVNNYKTEILQETEWHTIKWKDLKIGEVVRVHKNQTIPADLVFLSSSEPENIAYVETSSLDGETSLKMKQACYPISFDTIDSLVNVRCCIECEPPNRLVSEFTGTLITDNDKIPLSITQFLLRGAKLKNTKYIIGVVVYTGHDARLLMNLRTAPLKKSSIDKITNKQIMFLFIILIVITFASAIGAEIYDNILSSATYIPKQKSTSMKFLWNCLTFFILYNNIIPISLQVTLELVRFFQASFINSDILMYDEMSDTAANARTSNLNEELGLVKFIMTDKTGTLTCNIMKFKQFSIGKEIYGNDVSEKFEDDRIFSTLKSNTDEAKNLREFLLMMASCHTVVLEDQDDKLIYQSSSPDETALVEGAKLLGYTFYKRDFQRIFIKTENEDIKLEVLNVLEFSSDRKRMSVIVKDQNNIIKIYCKGADVKIFERLSTKLNDDKLLNTFKKHINYYCTKGYRTLCYSMAIIDSLYYEEWAKRFKIASTTMNNRNLELAKVSEEIEQNLKLIGVTAIEDKLQDFVPCTIKSLLAAGISIWMLTGDNQETAVNIAQSSALCNKNTKLLKLKKSENYEQVYTELLHLYNKAQKYITDGLEFALVISGNQICHILTSDAREIFTKLAFVCHAVICCRMTPIQKSEIVEIVRQLTKEIVLAVGDGANDVAMIQAANIGVGIIGREGVQAASASDYSIAQFHFLRRLLLVHGTWNLTRSVKVIFYSFYKNIFLYMIKLWFAFYSAFSSQTVFDKWTVVTFNVAFTAFPPIILGLFDKPISSKIIMRNPSLYKVFQQTTLSHKKFFYWIGLSIWHSILLYFFTYMFFEHETVWSSGHVGGWLMFGNSAYTFVITTVCLKALLECDSWTYIIWISCIGSIVLWFLFLALYSMTWPLLPIGAEIRGSAYIMFSSATFWLAFIFIPITTLLTDFIVKSVSTMFCPDIRQILLYETKKTSEFQSENNSEQQNLGLENYLNENLPTTSNNSNYVSLNQQNEVG